VDQDKARYRLALHARLPRSGFVTARNRITVSQHKGDQRSERRRIVRDRTQSLHEYVKGVQTKLFSDKDHFVDGWYVTDAHEWQRARELAAVALPACAGPSGARPASSDRTSDVLRARLATLIQADSQRAHHSSSSGH
jgi:hypothetical protein